MSNTIKDSSGSHTGRDVWEIVKQHDASFKLCRNGKVLHSSIPEKWLEDELGKYGFCGQEYRDIRQQLDQSGKVEIVFIN